MTSKERIRAALMGKQTDRVPSTMHCVNVTWDKLLEHFKVNSTDEVLDILDIDVRRMDLPPYIGPERPPVVNEKGETEYTHSLGYRYVDKWNGAEYNAHIVHYPLAEITTMEELEDFDGWVNPDWFDYSAVKDLCDRFPDKAIQIGWPGPYQVFTITK